MTEEVIKELGFELIKKYKHDQYVTHRYKKGALEMEFTYRKDKLIIRDLKIVDFITTNITLSQLKTLISIDSTASLI